METNKQLTLGSLFDGSGGFPLGGVLSGIKPVWSSEIEPFPVRVTEVRFPGVKNYGDVSKIKGSEVPPIDIITFGSPCQDMSIAGCRDGLGGSRSGLFYEAIRIIKEMREATDGRYPRYIVWENVPGAFTSNKGEDFRAVLEEICKVKDTEVSVLKPSKWENAGRILGDSYSVAWRVFDAQFWGVPQRRQRIYLVADFDGWGAGKILFESEGFSRYSAKSFKSWQNAAGCSVQGSGEAGCNGLMFENHSQDTRFRGPLEVSQTILSTFGTGGNNQPFIVQPPKTFDVRFTSEGTRNARQNVYETDTARTIDTGGNAPDSNQGGVAVCEPVAFGICSKASHSMMSDNPNSGFYKADTSRTLDGNGGNPSCNQGGIAVVEGNGSRPSHKGDGYKESDVMYTLNATEQHAVAFAEVHATLTANEGPKGPSSQMLGNPEENFVGQPAFGIDKAAMNQGANAQFDFKIEEEVEPTLVASGASGVAHPRFTTSKASFFTEANEELANTLVATDYKDPPIVNDIDYIVRRLTPTECARLQGFPDWWCEDLAIEEPSDEDIARWRGIFETYASALGKKCSKTDAQIKAWLKNPHSDSAEYKMWGNGVALPCVFFVLSGIVYYTQIEG